MSAGRGSLRPVPRLLITGSREWWDHPTMELALVEAWYDLGCSDVVLVHGAARGLDSWAAQFWSEHIGTTIEAHLANWDTLGKRAGLLRNLHMVTLGADLCLAFIHNGSRGATHCAVMAGRDGIPVRYFRTGAPTVL